MERLSRVLCVMAVSLLDKEDTGLVIIDIQDKLMHVIRRREAIVTNIIKLLHLSSLFSLPVILTEQYPKWLGTTIPEMKESLSEYEPIRKMEFNCCDDDVFSKRLKSAGLKCLILTGVESHVCVFQTCFSLLEAGYSVHVPRNAVSARKDEDWKVGLELMKEAGAVITSTETLIFQMLKSAGTKEFKQMLKVIR